MGTRDVDGLEVGFLEREFERVGFWVRRVVRGVLALVEDPQTLGGPGGSLQLISMLGC